MAEKWVVNASPLILLAKVGQVDLLFKLAEKVVIPKAVVVEISNGPADDPGYKWLAAHSSTLEIEVSVPPAQLLAWDLGAGETAVMAYAMENQGWTAIIDDSAARKCANSFAVPVKGTLAVVILAKQKGLITSAADVVRRLKSHDFYIKDSVIRDALAVTVGEKWEL